MLRATRVISTSDREAFYLDVERMRNYTDLIEAAMVEVFSRGESCINDS